ncbi:MAG: 30S ribosomal protein S3ae [Candidatus Thermoplasmatota archaeon]|nr:30S ribosomal protein S3ae [Candidatus Thermoplasmatota archaeon]
MAKKGARARVAARKMKDKWKSKEIYKLVAPDMFNNVVIGETLADDPSKVMGRKTEVTVQDLTGDFSKMHIKMIFQVDDVNGFNAHTKFIAHTLTNDYVRRLVRRKRSKMDAVFDVRTKDGYVVRLKPMAITDRRIQSAQKSDIRAIMAHESATYAKSHTLSELLKSLVDGNLQKTVVKSTKTIYPLKKIEFGKSEIVLEPDVKLLKERKVVEVGAEADAESAAEAPTEASPASGDEDAAIASLTTIPGVGPQKAKDLFAAGFTTIESVKSASLEDLEKVDGVGPAMAKKIQEAAAGM